jgi:hypothetical protein
MHSNACVRMGHIAPVAFFCIPHTKVSAPAECACECCEHWGTLRDNRKCACRRGRFHRVLVKCVKVLPPTAITSASLVCGVVVCTVHTRHTFVLGVSRPCIQQETCMPKTMHAHPPQPTTHTCQRACLLARTLCATHQCTLTVTTRSTPYIGFLGRAWTRCYELTYPWCAPPVFPNCPASPIGAHLAGLGASLEREERRRKENL